MYKKSSPTLRTALFILIAAVVAQLTFSHSLRFRLARNK